MDYLRNLAEASEQDLRPGDEDALPAGIDQQQQPGEGQGETIPPSNLDEALLRLGSDAVDWLPVQLRGSAGSNECPVPGCDLPGGHAGVHGCHCCRSLHKAAEAEIISDRQAVSLGFVTVGSPVSKRLALSAFSLRPAALPGTSS